MTLFCTVSVYPVKCEWWIVDVKTFHISLIHWISYKIILWRTWMTIDWIKILVYINNLNNIQYRVGLKVIWYIHSISIAKLVIPKNILDWVQVATLKSKDSPKIWDTIENFLNLRLYDDIDRLNCIVISYLSSFLSEPKHN